MKGNVDVMGIVNLSKEESLKRVDLRKQEVSEICLKMPNLDGLKSRVALVLDYSYSMENRYKNGMVQELVEKILPLAMNFDDNGEMELWIFSNGFHRLANITLDNYYGYVDNKILPKYQMGGTEFAPVMNDIKSRYIVEEPQNLPNYVLFVTDGDNSDPNPTTRLIKELSNHPIFFQFVGIGNCDFEYLNKLDTMGGRYVDNANFFAVKDIDNIEYKQLLKEYPEWIGNEKVQKMIQEQGTQQATQQGKQKKGLFSKLFG